MYKKIKKLYSLIATSLLASIPFIGTVNFAYATEDNKGTVNVHVNYDDDIEPSEGDVFTLTYSLQEDQNNTAIINIDASMFVEEDGQLSLPSNTYAILDITYGGTNQDIIEQGYGCNKSFYCSDRTDGSFTIAIGDQKVQSLSNSYGYDVRIKDSNHQENGEAYREDLLEDYQQNGANPYTQEEYDQDQENKKNNPETNDNNLSESNSESENITSNDTQNNENDETYSEAPITNTGEAKVENYIDEKEDEKNDNKDNNKTVMLSKLLLIIIVAIIGFAIIFVMHAKGIF